MVRAKPKELQRCPAAADRPTATAVKHFTAGNKKTVKAVSFFLGTTN